MSSFWNNRISISIFGEAQGAAIGVTIDNLPAGEHIDADALKSFMKRRAVFSGDVPSSGIVAVPRIMSGIYNDRTTGAPLCAFIQNVSSQPAEKPEERNVQTRVGLADYTGTVRYRGYNDVKEKSGFIDKLTIPLCFAGAVCGQILERRGIYTGAHILQLHNIKDNPFDPVNISRDGIISVRKKRFPVINDRKGWLMTDDLNRAAEGGETLGGVIECASVNVPAGIGSPVFNGLANNIAQLVFGIPDVKGLEFGLGFKSAGMVGRQSSDDFYIDERGYCVTRTNNHGGIIGGISSGMPITLKCAISPQEAGNSRNTGVPVASAVPCIEAAVNIALLSHMIDYPNFC